MPRLQLLSVENRLSRKKNHAEQRLVFMLRVANISYHKQVDILWAGDDGEWHTLSADFYARCGEHEEYWEARTTLRHTGTDLPSGTIRFAARLRATKQEYWDNHQGINFHSVGNSGWVLLNNTPVLHQHYAETLTDAPRFLPIEVLVSPEVDAEQVLIHWSTDHWQSTHTTPGHNRQRKASKNLIQQARHHPQTAAEHWKARIPINGAFRIDYCIACVTPTETLWDNNAGHNYHAQHKPLSLLILNLHCYQETEQAYKFSQIAKAIHELNADIVCLQEVAENWNNGAGDWDSNAARIINDQLPTPMHLHHDWSHLGFDRYREGVALLSRYPIHNTGARYVSESHDPYDINARKVIMGEISVPSMGIIQVYSAHLSWWEGGFREQFQRLSAWTEAQRHPEVAATLLCGDFNITPGSDGYRLVVAQHDYVDQFLAARQPAASASINNINDAYWQTQASDDYRIDYIFMHKYSTLQALSARVVFTDADYGSVSDHCGYFMRFEPQ